jgi:hypothetical protein
MQAMCRCAGAAAAAHLEVGLALALAVPDLQALLDLAQRVLQLLHPVAALVLQRTVATAKSSS